jgi:hypothetical protein
VDAEFVVVVGPFDVVAGSQTDLYRLFLNYITGRRKELLLGKKESMRWGLSLCQHETAII